MTDINRFSHLPEGHPRRRQEEERLQQQSDPTYYKPRAIAQADADTDALYQRVIGNRGLEYINANEEATAYAAAGYLGTVPPSVQSWATVKGWTGQQAADDILAQAAQWSALRAATRLHRLTAKEAIRVAEDYAGVQAALAAWNGFLQAVSV